MAELDPVEFALQAEISIAIWEDVRARWFAQRADLERTADAVFQLHCERPCPAHHRTVLATYPHPDPDAFHQAAGIACLLTPKDPTP